MGPKGDAKAKARKSAGRNRPVKPALGRRIWHLVINHPKGVLIGAATLLGLIVVFQNWRSTPAFLLVTDVSLPFVLWALVFMVTGYATGKWLEWGWRQRKIRKGTYKPRVSAEDLADTAAHLDDRLEAQSEDGATKRDATATTTDDVADPATVIDRRQPTPDDEGHAPVQRVDYWDDAAGGGEGPEPRVRTTDDSVGTAGSGGHRAGGDWSPAARHAAREADRARARRGRDERYGDYQDAGRYGDYQDAGRYGDYQDAGRYGDYQDAGRYGDYSDYDDGPDGRSGRGGASRSSNGRRGGGGR